MKKFKNIIALIAMFIVVYCVGMVNVFATEVTLLDAREGHKYEFYQIFSGDYSQGVLTSIVWGSGLDISSNEFLEYLENYGDGATAAYVSEILVEQFMNDSSSIKIFSKEIANYLVDTPYATAEEIVNGTVTINIKDSGYYLIKDITGADNVYSMNVLEVMGSDGLELQLKYLEEPVLEKSVLNEDGQWVNATDYDIGDKVLFKLEATVPFVDEYDEYKMIFYDFLSDGLTFDINSVKVYVDGVEVDETYYAVVVDGPLNSNASFSIEINDINNITNYLLTSESIVTVEYSATLNENAIYGATGNPNVAYLEYSSDPNGTDATSVTPEDGVVVYTYKLTVNKVDEKGDPLEGAEFKLEKLEEDVGYLIVSEITGGDALQFDFIGLDSGTYRLTEITAPIGYNKLEKPIEIVINATIDEDMEYDGSASALTSLSASLDGDLRIDGELDSGTITFAIENVTGVSLPSTGGIGTIIFTVSGLMIMSIALYLIIKRKKQN